VAVFDIDDIVQSLQTVRQNWREVQKRSLEPGGRDLPAREALAGIVDALKGVLFPMRLGPPWRGVGVFSAACWQRDGCVVGGVVRFGIAGGGTGAFGGVWGDCASGRPICVRKARISMSPMRSTPRCMHCLRKPVWS
jgi:hypothetical protein